MSNGQGKSEVNDTIILSRSNGFTIVAEAGKLCLLKKKEKGKQEKKVIWGQCNPMEMPRLLFSEEAGLVSQETFDCIYLLLQKKKKKDAFLLLPSFVS